MITGEYKKLKEIAEHNVCAEHKAALEVCWAPDGNVYALRCGEGHYAEAVTRKVSEVTKIKQAVKPDIPLNAFAMPSEDLGTKKLLSITEQQALIDYGRHYGLDAYRGHVMMMFGKPYIGLDGYIFVANRTRRPYTMPTRPANAEERLAMQIGVDDYCWICELQVENPRTYVRAIGIVTAEELTETSKKDTTQLRYPVVAKHPQLLAQKRAEWQALRRAFPIGENEEEQP